MIKYYYGSEIYGRIYDWNKIYNMYQGLKIPDTVYVVPKEALKSKYSVLLSSRSIGKTTNVLLLGLCQRAVYGTQVVYIRSTEAEFTPTEAKKLVEIINSYKEGEYIKKLTQGRYNKIIYKARAFYYALIEDGEIIAKDEEECIKVLTVDRHFDYKSTLNMPRGDFFIYDEFIGKRYTTDNDFVSFCDLFKTVARDRLSPVIFMTANTISATSPYYSELEIKKYIRALKSGEHISVETDGGTKIYIELCKLPERAQEKRAFFNSLFLGFKNEKLGAITGGQLWALPKVPHLYRRAEDDVPQYLMRNLYMYNSGDMLRCDLVKDKQSGVHLEVVPAFNDPKDDAIILTTEIPTDKRELYLLGGRKRKIRKVLLDLISDGKVFFATNEEGALFKNYIETALQLEKMPLI